MTRTWFEGNAVSQFFKIALTFLLHYHENMNFIFPWSTVQTVTETTNPQITDRFSYLHHVITGWFCFTARICSWYGFEGNTAAQFFQISLGFFLQNMSSYKLLMGKTIIGSICIGLYDLVSLNSRVHNMSHGRLTLDFVCSCIFSASLAFFSSSFWKNWHGKWSKYQQSDILIGINTDK